MKNTRNSPFEIPIRVGLLSFINEIFKDNNTLIYSHRYNRGGEKLNKQVKLKRDLVIYLVFYLVRITEKQDYGIRLDSKLLRNNFLDAYKPYISFLENNNILIHAGNYSVGQQSNFYGLTDFYYKLNKRYIRYEITDINLLKKVNLDSKGLNKDQLLNNQKCKKMRNHLVKHFDKYLEIDIDAAYSEIANLDISAFDSNCITIHQFESKNWKYVITEKDFRLHTIISRINNKLLKYITYKNQTLGEIDFKTSQPLFLYIILKTVFDDSINGLVGLFLKEKLGIGLIKKILQQGINVRELSDLGNIILNEDLYINVGNNIKTNKPTQKGYYYIDKSKPKWKKEYFNTKRDLIKNIVMRSFYNGKGEEIEEFKKMFPSIFKVIEIINKETNITKSKCNLSHILQSFEAYIVLDLIAKDVSKQFKNIPLFSKHDSIITYNSSIDEVHEFVLNRFEYYFGFSKRKLITTKSW
jgi:hypothetical protein